MSGLNETTALAGVATAGALLTIHATTLVFVPKSAMQVRLGAAAAIAGLTRLLCSLLFEVTTRPSLRSAFGTLTILTGINAAEELLISRIDAGDLSDGKGHPQTGTGTLLWRALCMAFSARRVGTRWEIPNLRRRAPQGRARFLLSRLAKLGAAYLILDLSGSAPPPEMRLLAGGKDTLFHPGQLTSEDVVFRLGASFGFWLSSFLVNIVVWESGAFATVLLGLCRPEDWPRLNGPLSTIYTVRGFWGTFWHQCLRKNITAWGDLVSDTVLRLRRGTLVSRYTRIFLAFLVSGAMHVIGDRGFRIPYREMRSVPFFCLQALGITLEDGVQAATRGWGIPGPVRRLVGYVWVVGFLWWSTPMWFYPLIVAQDDPGIVPFSVVGWAMGGAKLTA